MLRSESKQISPTIYVNNQPIDNHRGIKQPNNVHGGARSEKVGIDTTTGGPAGGRLRTLPLQHSLRELILVSSYMMFRQV
jgi:hypothetical protein